MDTDRDRMERQAARSHLILSAVQTALVVLAVGCMALATWGTKASVERILSDHRRSVYRNHAAILRAAGADRESIAAIEADLAELSAKEARRARGEDADAD